MSASLLQHKLQELHARRSVEIIRSVEALIRAGELGPGEVLPPVRLLADRLALSPTTVASAYRALGVRGLVVAAGRRGTRVSARPAPVRRAVQGLPPGARDLASGNPDPALLPDLGAALARLGSRQRLYGEPGSNPELLRLAAAELAAGGVPAEHLTPVGGAMDGIERALAAHLAPGDRVAVEDPGYPALMELLGELGLVTEGLPVDASGLLPDALAGALAGLAAVVLTPRAQNPTGAALDERRALDLREVLRRRPDLLVVEDDHAGAIAGARAFSVAGGTEHWAVVRSVSKWLGPDLRVAVLAGDEATAARVAGRQRLGTGWVSHLLQSLVTELWRDPATPELTERATGRYRERRQAMLEALARHGLAGEGRSGFNVWVPVADEQASLRRLLEAGWAAAPGERFRIRSRPGIRITVAGLAPSEAEAVAAALARRGPGVASRSG